MLLSDQGILDRVDKGEIILKDPTGRPVLGKTFGDRGAGTLQSHGYDLRIDDVFSWVENDWVNLKQKQVFIVKPGDNVIIRTYESIQLGKSVAATLHAMARRTLLGLTTFPTTIHAGWGTEPITEEPLYVLAANIGRSDTEIRHGDRFCRLLFFEVSPPSQLPAPELSTITDAFRKAVAKEQPKYSQSKKRTGGILVLLLLVGMAILLYGIFLINPLLLPIFIPIFLIIGNLILDWIKKQ